jgi:hypothetical protein
MNIPAEFLAAALNAFEANKRLADRAVEQVPDAKLHVALGEETNSIAVIMKHVAGNLLSRWTDFLTTDGEKPGRHRDDEFVDSYRSRAELLEFWERGWARLLALRARVRISAGSRIRCRWRFRDRWGTRVITSDRSCRSPAFKPAKTGGR